MRFKEFILNEDAGAPPGPPGGAGPMGIPPGGPPMGGPPGGAGPMGMPPGGAGADPMGGGPPMPPAGGAAPVGPQVAAKMRDADVWTVLEKILGNQKDKNGVSGGKNGGNMLKAPGGFLMS